MNRKQLIIDLIAEGVPPSHLDTFSTPVLADLLESVKRRSDAGGSRVSHSDGGGHQTPSDGADKELAALCRHFDGAPEVLEAYHRADPWLVGEAAALAAAQRSVFGGER